MNVYFGVCIFLQLTLGVLAFNPRRIQQSEPQSKDLSSEIADETIQLINTGRELITFDPAYKNVVLVIGNTGAGKTTTTKFITGQPLESYKVPGKYLIRDTGGKISAGSTLVSKTIFPEMFVDEESNTAYYDLPGFSDTRNASIELANAWFMKLVADHVEKVKILVVVTHSSLTPGESRTDFKGLLEHATSFVRHPAKFKASIALVATKVNSYIPDDEIVPAIAEFIEMEKNNLHSIFEENKLRQVLALVDAFLTQSPTGEYERIGFFKTPTKPGPLDKIPATAARRQALKAMIETQLIFEKKTEKDFAISITDNARFYVRVIVEKLNSKFTQIMFTFAPSIEKHFSQSSESPLESYVGKLVQDVAQLDRMATALQRSVSRPSFLKVLEEQSPSLPGFNDTMKELRNLHENLEFYERIDTRSIAPESLEWAEPIREAVDKLKIQVSTLLVELSSKAEDWASQMVHSYEKSYEEAVTKGLGESPKTQETIKQSLSQDLQILETMKNSLLAEPSFNSFINHASKSFGELSVKISSAPSNQPPLLAVDILFQGHPQLKKDSWIHTIYQLLQSVTRKQADFIRTLQEREYKKGIESLNSNITDLQRKNEQISKNATESIGRLSQDIEKHRKEILEKTKNVEALTNNVKQVNDQIVALEKAKKEIEEKAKKEGRINEEMMKSLTAMGNSIGKLQNDLREKEKEAKEQQKALNQQIEQMKVREEAARREAQKNKGSGCAVNLWIIAFGCG